MKNLCDLDKYRYVVGDIHRYNGYGGSKQGVFIIPNDPPLRVIADSGQGWDHVSVSTETRCPTWEEMDRIKRIFFKDHETAVQYHVPASDHINIHDYCLHLWRPTFKRFPMPPKIRV